MYVLVDWSLNFYFIKYGVLLYSRVNIDSFSGECNSLGLFKMLKVSKQSVPILIGPSLQLEYLAAKHLTDNCLVVSSNCIIALMSLLFIQQTMTVTWLLYLPFTVGTRQTAHVCLCWLNSVKCHCFFLINRKTLALWFHFLCLQFYNHVNCKVIIHHCLI